MKKLHIVVVVVVVVVLAALVIGWQFSGREVKNITSFEECAAAGNPIMESYPEQCRTADGRTFVRQIPPVEEPVFCTADAKQCADGSYVGRSGPRCEFTPCPGE